MRLDLEGICWFMATNQKDVVQSEKTAQGFKKEDEKKNRNDSFLIYIKILIMQTWRAHRHCVEIFLLLEFIFTPADQPDCSSEQEVT